MSEVFYKFITNEKNKHWKKNLSIQNKGRLGIPRGYSKKSIEERWKMVMGKNKQLDSYLKEQKKQKKNKKEGEEEAFENEYYDGIKEELLDNDTLHRSEIYNNNIENFIGMVEIPLGIAGPLKCTGVKSSGEYFIPLATTESTIVASYNRGIKLINACGGCRSVVVLEGLSRDPVFYFHNLVDLGKFLIWARKNKEKFIEVAQSTTNHGKLIEIKYMIEGNAVNMKCNYTCGDAGGQNMVTIATQEIVVYIEKNSPVPLKGSVLEGGMSADKKATQHHMITCRGKRVISEAIITREKLIEILKVTPEELLFGMEVMSRGYRWLGAIAYNGNFANGMSAMAIALGQDPACVSETHIGTFRCELTAENDLYICVTCPNLICASVGGGTKLPCNRACLEMMGLLGPGKANELAEVMAGVLLAGEISLAGATFSGELAKAYRLLHKDFQEEEIVIDLEKDTIDQAFVKCHALLIKLSEIPDKKTVLKLYGLNKQATEGDIKKRMKFFANTKQRKKFEAWKEFKGMSKEDAKKKYVEMIMEIEKIDKEKRENKKE